MLIKFDLICKKYGIPRGIVHIGAHMMEERNEYLSKGLENTIWVEANPAVYKKAKNLIRFKQHERLFNCAATEEDGLELDFYVTNSGQSSSILELGTHKDRHPNIKVINTIKVNTRRMDSLLAENNISLTDHNFLNLDIQGAELLAMKGFGKALGQFDFVYTEVNTNYLYKNCALLGEIDEYLRALGFNRSETEMTVNEWGDALYLKQR